MTKCFKLDSIDIVSDFVVRASGFHFFPRPSSCGKITLDEKDG